MPRGIPNPKQDPETGRYVPKTARKRRIRRELGGMAASVQPEGWDDGYKAGLVHAIQKLQQELGRLST